MLPQIRHHTTTRQQLHTHPQPLPKQQQATTSTRNNHLNSSSTTKVPKHSRQSPQLTQRHHTHNHRVTQRSRQNIQRSPQELSRLLRPQTKRRLQEQKQRTLHNITRHSRRQTQLQGRPSLPRRLNRQKATKERLPYTSQILTNRTKTRQPSQNTKTIRPTQPSRRPT